MKQFARLYVQLDSSTSTIHKVTALADYFRTAEPASAAWALYFLCGHKVRQSIPTRQLARMAARLAHVPDWLFAECYETVGDLAETITLLLPHPTAEGAGPLHEWIPERLMPLRTLPVPQQEALITETWMQLAPHERFVWNKLITGGFRVGVSQQLVIRAISQVAQLPAALIAHRLMGTWEPTAEFFQSLIAPEQAGIDHTRPYPFCLAYALSEASSSPETTQTDAASVSDSSPATDLHFLTTQLGPATDWHAEWKWDGIRAQLIQRRGDCLVWSRGEELIGARFPELVAAAAGLPDGTVLDGEILGWKEGTVLPFAQLQRRIGRKTVGKKLLTEVPVALIVFDLLEFGGVDLRPLPFQDRRRQLEELLAQSNTPAIRLSPAMTGTTWDDFAAARANSREQQVEGLMLKRKSSSYGVGRARGDWWKWKIDPLTIDAVLIYAQLGHGKRASLYTDYTFAVWQEGELVPFAKAYSGLTDAEIREVDKFVRGHTIERFGPVRSVTAELVFELAFENIQRSSRHKSGIAVRFPRMVRWRKDKTPAQADSLATIQALLP